VDVAVVPPHGKGAILRQWVATDKGLVVKP